MIFNLSSQIGMKIKVPKKPIFYINYISLISFRIQFKNSYASQKKYANKLIDNQHKFYRMVIII